MRTLLFLAALSSVGCGDGDATDEPKAATTIEWDDRGLVATLGETAPLGVQVKIGEVAPPCEISSYFVVNDVEVFANTEYSPGETWTIVMSYTPGANLPVGTTIVHQLVDLEDPGALVRPFSAWVESDGAIVARREW